MLFSYKKIQNMIGTILEYCPNVANVYTQHVGNYVVVRVTYHTAGNSNETRQFYYKIVIEDEDRFDEGEHLGNIIRQYDSRVKNC